MTKGNGARRNGVGGGGDHRRAASASLSSSSSPMPPPSPSPASLALLAIPVLCWLIVTISLVPLLDVELLDDPNLEGMGRSTAELEAWKEARRIKNFLPRYPIDHRREAREGGRGGGDRALARSGRSGGANGTLVLGEPSAPPLSDRAVRQCHLALWHTVRTTATVLPNDESFVKTGDIKEMWLRDSAAQVHPLLIPGVYEGQSLVRSDPKLARVVSGLILRCAKMIRYDPYANAFNIREDSQKYGQFDRTKLGRHGFVATRNYELDSVAYFLRMVYFFRLSLPHHPVLPRREVRDAARIAVDLWKAEQRHEEDAYPSGPLFDCSLCGKPYRYNPAELPRNGKGSKTNASSGLTWSGFRPSDDPCQKGYLIPANMMASVALGYVAEMAEEVWIDEPLKKEALALRSEIDEGIRRHGIVKHKEHGRIYAYEVDGLGNGLFMDDANVPSLLSIPYLGYPYDKEVFANTKRFIFSKHNAFFHQGKFEGVEYYGIGSPHTRHVPNSIWPMAMIVEALISDNVTFKVLQTEKLLTASAGTGWMHESFDPNRPAKYSRPWFCWPDALFAELVMSLTTECPKPREGMGYRVHRWEDPEDVEGGPFEAAAGEVEEEEGHGDEGGGGTKGGGRGGAAPLPARGEPGFKGRQTDEQIERRIRERVKRLQGGVPPGWEAGAEPEDPERKPNGAVPRRDVRGRKLSPGGAAAPNSGGNVKLRDQRGNIMEHSRARKAVAEAETGDEGGDDDEEEEEEE
ncbi:hypothetical protein ACHAWF_003462 [Thalassiosira exigua]